MISIQKIITFLENILVKIIFVIISILHGPLVRIKKKLKKKFILGPFWVVCLSPMMPLIFFYLSNNQFKMLYDMVVTQKMIRILSRAFLASCQLSILENCDRNIWANGEGDRRAEGILFLVHLLKFESDTATSKNIAIIKL